MKRSRKRIRLDAGILGLPTVLLASVLAFLGFDAACLSVVSRDFEKAVKRARLMQTNMVFPRLFMWNMVSDADFADTGRRFRVAYRGCRPKRLVLQPGTQSFNMLRLAFLVCVLPVFSGVEELDMDLPTVNPSHIVGALTLVYLPALRRIRLTGIGSNLGLDILRRPPHLLTHLEVKVSIVHLMIASDKTLKQLESVMLVDDFVHDERKAAVATRLSCLTGLRKLHWTSCSRGVGTALVGQLAKYASGLTAISGDAWCISDLEALLPLRELTVLPGGFQSTKENEAAFIRKAIQAWPRLRLWPLPYFWLETFFAETMDAWPLFEDAVELRQEESVQFDVAYRWLARHPKAKITRCAYHLAGSVVFADRRKYDIGVLNRFSL